MLRARVDALRLNGEADKAREWLATFRVSLQALDALHAAVAAIQGCLLLTADATLAKACAKLGVAARLIS